MTEQSLHDSSTTDGLPLAPSLEPSLVSALIEKHSSVVDRRVVFISLLSSLIAVLATLVAQGLLVLIDAITQVTFYGRFGIAPVSPAYNALGHWLLIVPVVGGAVVGLLARFGSAAIRGHGIPEAMEQVLLNQSRVPPRLTFLKPISSAIAIGTGGPFGAEGPIIATGGALGSLVGQMLKVTAEERKVLLAAGAAAGMAAIFGSPVSAVLLAVELLLFEFRPQSLLPVALASTVACGGHVILFGPDAMFATGSLASAHPWAVLFYTVSGGVFGLAAAATTLAVYRLEDLFEKLPVHWMWWPAIGGIAVGTIGIWAPRTLGVGYENIAALLDGNLVLSAAIVLGAMKFLSWAISLASGTSGGTLAPLLTIGGALGYTLGRLMAALLPGAGIDPKMCALVGMAALFAGASRALFASVVFAVEVTRQPAAVLPLLGSCAVAYLVSTALTRQSIMTEKIARRGVQVPVEYAADFFSNVFVRDFMTRGVITLQASEKVDDVLRQIFSGGCAATHHGFPVIDVEGRLTGVVTRTDLLRAREPQLITVGQLITRPPIVIEADASIRQAMNLLSFHGVGRLPVVSAGKPERLAGILTRQDVLTAYRSIWFRARHRHRHLRFPESLSFTRPAQRAGRPS